MIRQVMGRLKTGVKMATRTRMDAFDLLRSDHMKVEGLAVQIRVSRDNKRSKELLGKLTHLMEAHMKLEEDIFYPACATIEKLQKLIDHAHADHQLVKDVLKDLNVMEPQSRGFTVLLNKATVKIVKHVYEEENRIFGIVTREMNREDLRQLSRRIIEAHSRIEEEAASKPPKAA